VEEEIRSDFLPEDNAQRTGSLFKDAFSTTVFVGIIITLNVVLLGALVIGLIYSPQGLTAESMQSGTFFDVSNAILSLSFSGSVLIYFILYKGMSLGEIKKTLGLGRENLTLRNLSVGIVIFSALILLTFAIGIISLLTNTQISSNAEVFFGGAPFWYLAFTSVIAPINEETLFRGFLVARLGILFSALIFGLLHYAYNSTFGIEMIFAFIFGLMAGYAFKKSNSLYPSLLAHILYNTASLFIL
jgi:uncharacterized protein